MKLWRIDAADCEEADYVTLFFRSRLAAEMHSSQMIIGGWECEIIEEDLPIDSTELARLVGSPGPLPWPCVDSADLIMRLRDGPRPNAQREAAEQLKRLTSGRKEAAV